MYWINIEKIGYRKYPIFSIFSEKIMIFSIPDYDSLQGGHFAVSIKFSDLLF